MKFLILGAGGMAGHVITIYLIEKGHDVTGFDKKQLHYCNTIVGDARNESLIAKVIKVGEYDTIINCIGILNQFAEQNKSLAVYLNAWLPNLLADLTRDSKTKIIHMSTDCVFSGKRGNYTEQDIPDGETIYDKTKALGELNDNKNITLRNSIVGPDINENGIGLLNWFMKEEGPVKGYINVLWTGLTTLQLAKAMEQAAEDRITGLYNMVYSEPITKYNLLLLFNKYLRKGTVVIEPSDVLVVNKSLKRTNFDFDYLIPDYEKMIYELAVWINNHLTLYPHYPIQIR
jgi:dTDP-4-dehydrorhamnose reductase